jgi:Cys/Met metabolism PLP-dependent enzyme
MSHSVISQEERDAVGISDTLIRLSVGLEDTDDLIQDMKQALDLAYDWVLVDKVDFSSNCFVILVRPKTFSYLFPGKTRIEIVWRLHCSHGYFPLWSTNMFLPSSFLSLRNQEYVLALMCYLKGTCKHFFFIQTGNSEYIFKKCEIYHLIWLLILKNEAWNQVLKVKLPLSIMKISVFTYFRLCVQQGQGQSHETWKK